MPSGQRSGLRLIRKGGNCVRLLHHELLFPVYPVLQIVQERRGYPTQGHPLLTVLLHNLARFILMTDLSVDFDRSVSLTLSPLAYKNLTLPMWACLLACSAALPRGSLFHFPLTCLRTHRLLPSTARLSLLAGSWLGGPLLALLSHWHAA